MLKAFQKVSHLLEYILKGEIKIKLDSSLRSANPEEIDCLNLKILSILGHENKGNCKLLVRGTKKEILTKRLVSKLNSNDSLYDGIFLVGEKAKNYLHKCSEITHPIKIITDTGNEVVSWIFDSYSQIPPGQETINTEYFKEKKNKQKFINKIKSNQSLTDYYLYGIHTWDSGNLVNFVSATTDPEVSFDCNNDLIIIFWLNQSYSRFSMSKSKLEEQACTIKKLKLPLLNDSFHPGESEVSMKGFILPHYILGVYDKSESYFVPNPEIFKEKDDWKEDGFDINHLNFEAFIKNTQYKRFLSLINGATFIENK